jgi:hypothetical protein
MHSLEKGFMKSQVGQGRKRKLLKANPADFLRLWLPETLVFIFQEIINENLKDPISKAEFFQFVKVSEVCTYS